MDDTMASALATFCTASGSGLPASSSPRRPIRSGGRRRDPNGARWPRSASARPDGRSGSLGAPPRTKAARSAALAKPARTGRRPRRGTPPTRHRPRASWRPQGVQIPGGHGQADRNQVRGHAAQDNQRAGGGFPGHAVNTTAGAEPGHTLDRHRCPTVGKEASTSSDGYRQVGRRLHQMAGGADPPDLAKKLYFRSEVRGLSTLPPQGSALIVANHPVVCRPSTRRCSPSTTTRSSATTRPVYVLGHDDLFHGPVVDLLGRSGIIPARLQKNAAQALGAGALVLVFLAATTTSTGRPWPATSSTSMAAPGTWRRPSARGCRSSRRSPSAVRRASST